MIPGIKLTIGDEEYVVPALTLGQLRNEGMLDKMKQHDAKLADAETYFDALDIRAEIILAALQRNYPDVTLDKLRDQLDLGNVSDIWNAVMGASGMIKTSGEASPA